MEELMSAHLVVRDASLVFDPAKMKTNKAGDFRILIQAHRNRRPFRADLNGYPIRVKEGDTVYLMEKGYGIYDKSHITSVSKVLKINTPQEFRAIRDQYDPYLSNPYWRMLQQRFKNINRGQFLGLCFVEIEIDQGDNRFKVNFKNGTRCSWITLKGQSDIDSWIDFDSTPEETAYEDIGSYSEIPPRTRYKVSRIWRINSMDQKDFDHFIPKSVGAPGFLEENIIPTALTVNRGKSNCIPKELVEITYEYKKQGKFRSLDITRDDINNWDPFISRSEKFKPQQSKARQIVSEVAKWQEKDQRKFYKDILKQAFDRKDPIAGGKNIESLSQQDLIRLIKTYRNTFVFDIDAMFKAAGGTNPVDRRE